MNKNTNELSNELSLKSNEINEITGYDSSIGRDSQIRKITNYLKSVSYKATDCTLSQIADKSKTLASDSFKTQQFIDEIKKLLKFVLDENEKIIAVGVEKELKALKKDIDGFAQSIKLETDVINSFSQAIQMTYKRLKNFNGWACTIKKYSDNNYKVEGFSNNSTVLLDTSISNKVKITILPLFFKSKEQSAHWLKLTQENEATLQSVVKNWLGNITSSVELDNVMLVQKKLADEKEKEKLVKDWSKLNEQIAEFQRIKTEITTQERILKQQKNK